MQEKLKKALILCLKYLVSAAILALVLGPVLVTFFASIKTQAHMASTSPIWFPPAGEITWANYQKVLGAKLLGKLEPIWLMRLFAAFLLFSSLQMIG